MKPPKHTLPESMIPFESLLSDDLKKLGARFAEFRGGSLTLSEVALNQVLDEFKQLCVRAKQYENEISMLAWNARAALDNVDQKWADQKQANRALLEAINDPDSNVVIMPARHDYPEIPFDDGRFPA